MTKVWFLLSLMILSGAGRCQQDSDLSGVYHATSKKRIGRIKGFTDQPEMRFVYRLSLLPANQFEFISCVDVSRLGQGVNYADSLKLRGKVEYNGSTIKLIHPKYFDPESGINWKLRRNSIIVYGRNTRRVKLKRIL